MSVPKKALLIAPKRRFLDLDTTPPTCISEGSLIVGNVHRSGQFVLCGEVQGAGEIEGGLILAANGVWHGQIQAQQAIVAGKIIGGLSVKDKLEIGYTAVIRGRVSARTVAIARGAIVDGDIEVTSEAAVTEFEEKRS